MNYYREEVETDALVPAKIFFGGTSADKLRYPLHWHQNLEFNLVLSGSICGKISGRAVKAGPGEIFFVNSGELHETDGGQDGPLRSVTVLLSNELLKEYCQETEQLYFSFERGSSQEKRLADLVLQCAETERERKRYYELELSILLRQICKILLQECSREKTAAEGSAMEYRSIKRVKKAITYMEENFENRISVEDMGKVMGMTPSYFSRFFRQSTGQTFHVCLTRIRLIHARMMLLEQDYSVTEIALNCGFPNVKAFIDAFKKEYQATPAKYKKDKKQQ